MSKTQIIIDLPSELAEEIIQKVAKHRKNMAKARAVQQRNSVPVDEKLPDEDYLKAEIISGILTDYKTVIMNESAREAAKKTGEELDRKLSNTKK